MNTENVKKRYEVERFIDNKWIVYTHEGSIKDAQEMISMWNENSRARPVPARIIEIKTVETRMVIPQIN